jgi:signal transduction histidine kinase/ActR/RegA family two-component response regulator
MRLIIFFLFLVSFSFSQNIVTINSNITDIKKFKINYFIDKTKKLQFKDIQSMHFIEGQNSATLGANITDTWIKIKLLNTTKNKQTLFLHQDLGYTFLRINYFEVDSNNTILNKKGIQLSSSTAKEEMIGADAVFKFSLEPKEIKTIYVNQKSHAYHFYNFSILSEKKSIEYLIFEKVDGILFVGLLLALTVFNLLLYVTSRLKEYLYYSLYLFSATIWIFYMYGSLAHYFNIYGEMPFRFNFGLMFIPIFLALFVQTIFETKKLYKTEHKFLNSMIVILLINFMYGLIDFNNALQILSLVLNYALITFIWISISLYIKGNKIVKIFLWAHIFYLIFNIYAILFYMGIVEFSYIAFHGIGIGVIMEALMLSYLLSYKFKVMAQEKEHIKMEKLKAEIETKTKTEFLANMSHEIRTPMNGIIGMAHLSLNCNDMNKQKEYTEKINSSAKLLLNIINDILDFSKMEAKKMIIDPLDFNLNKLLEDVSNLLEFKAKEKNILFKINYPKELNVFLHGDVIKISQILINLISNAIKFTDIGHVKVNMKNIKDDIYCFSIEDTGIGISENGMKNLFKSFSQVDASISRKYGGTGLGLSISKQLVELMGGKIWVDSTENKGSTFFFTLYLPKVKKEEIIQLDSEVTIVDFSIFKDSNILLVEDNNINQELILGLLEHTGISIDIASNGKEAVEIHEQNIHKYDLILMDIQMPIMDGYESVNIIRQKDENTPIIALSANSMDMNKVRSYQMQDYLQKPIEIKRLNSILQEYIKQKKTMKNNQKTQTYT